MPVVEVDIRDLKNLGVTEEEAETVGEMVKAVVEEREGEIWKFEVTSDRPDMLSSEGIARTIKGFLGREVGLPAIRAAEGPELRVGNPERSCVVAFSVRNVDLKGPAFRNLIQFQEKLAQILGRNRREAAVGVHDLDRISGPVVYREAKPGERFVPLEMYGKMSLEEIVKKHPKGIYGRGSGFQVFEDAEGIISFPPVINSERTKVTEDTKNLFVEITGTNPKTVEDVAKIMISNLCERGWAVERWVIGGEARPDLSPRQVGVETAFVNSVLGLELKPAEISAILERMRFGVLDASDRISVLVPPFRIDILHPVDIAEDVAVGYGYNNMVPVYPKVHGIGSTLRETDFSEAVAELMIGLGFQEILSFVLTSPKNQNEKMGVKTGGIKILNPCTRRFTTCRTWILPSVLEFLSANCHREYPQKVFEIGDCVIPGSTETGFRTRKKLAFAIAHDRANFTEGKSVVEALLRSLGLSWEIEEKNHPSFIESRCASVTVGNREAGFFGELKPEVLLNWKLEKPVVCGELDLERVMP